MKNTNTSAVASDTTQVRFCKYYESKETEYNLMTIVKDELTPVGLEKFNAIKDYLYKNRVKYLQFQKRQA